ncbi:hypothetical protein Tco_1577567 [Tanacetum coccineum]
MGYSALNCKGLDTMLGNAGRQRAVQDYDIIKEKMLMCNQAEQRCSTLRAGKSHPERYRSTSQPLEQVQNHDENDVFANVRRHSEQPESINDTYVLEKDDSNKRLERLEKSKEINIECESYVKLRSKIESLSLKLAKFENSSYFLQEMIEKQRPKKDKKVFGFTEDRASTSEAKPRKLVQESGNLSTVELAKPVPSAREPPSSDVGNQPSTELCENLDSNHPNVTIPLHIRFWGCYKETKKKIMQIKERLKTEQDRQKSYADKKRKPLKFNVGDRVLLKVSPWKGVVRFGKKGKLAPQYVGPFEIVERVGPVAYRLRLPQELSCIHDTFHVSNLKKCLAEKYLQVTLEEIKIDDRLYFVKELVEIVDMEVKRLKRSWIPIVKVRWKSRQGVEFTWERKDQFKTKYLHLFATSSSAAVATLWDASPSPNHVNDLPADEPQSPDNVFDFPVGEPHGFDDLDVEVKEDVTPLKSGRSGMVTMGCDFKAQGTSHRKTTSKETFK